MSEQLQRFELIPQNVELLPTGGEVPLEILITDPTDLAEFEILASYGDWYCYYEIDGLTVRVFSHPNTDGTKRTLKARIRARNANGEIVETQEFTVTQYGTNDYPTAMHIVPALLEIPPEGGSASAQIELPEGMSPASYEIIGTGEDSLRNYTIAGDTITFSAGANDRNKPLASRSTSLLAFDAAGNVIGSANISVFQREIRKVSVSPERVNFDACGGATNISLSRSTSAGKISASTAFAWLLVESGKIYAAENNTEDPRTGTITFSGEYGGSVVLEVSQDAYTADASIRVSPGTIEFPPAGGMQHVNIVTSGNAGAVQISTEADWLMVDADANVIAEANPLTQAREARIEFRGGNMPAGTSASVTVTQAGARKLPAAFYRGTRAK